MKAGQGDWFNWLIGYARSDGAIVSIVYSEPENCFEITYNELGTSNILHMKRCYDLEDFVKRLNQWTLEGRPHVPFST